MWRQIFRAHREAGTAACQVGPMKLVLGGNVPGKAT